MGFAPIRHNIPNIVLAPFWCWNSPDLHPCQPRDTKENTIHQTRPPFSIFSMLTCLLLARSVRTGVSMGTLSGLWLCILIHNKLMHCVFWYLSIRTSINFFSNLKNISSSVGSDHTARPLLPTCINEPWPPMTLSLVHHCSFLGPLFFCWPFISFSNRTAEDVTGNRMRERGSDTQQRAPGQDSRRGCHREDKASVHGIPTLST